MEDEKNSKMSSKNSKWQNGNQNQNGINLTHPIPECEDKNQVIKMDNSDQPQLELTAPVDVKEKLEKTQRSIFLRHFGGIILTLIASLLSSTNLIFVKMLQKSGITGPESTFWGYFGVFFPSIPLIIYFECQLDRKCFSRKHQPRDSVFNCVWPLNISQKRINAIGLVIQAIFGAGSILFRYWALSYITVGDTAVICVGTPIIVSILAHFFLNEKTGFVPIFVAILALVGVFIMSRPPIFTGNDSFDTPTLTGTGFAILSLVCTALQTIIWRKIRGVQFAVQLLVSGFIGFSIPLLVALIMNNGHFTLPSTSFDILLAVTISTFGFALTLFMMLALKVETASVVSLTRTCDGLFGFLLQFIFFAVQPDIYSSIGGLIICLGVLVTGFRKFLEVEPTENGNQSRWRKYFGFLLR